MFDPYHRWLAIPPGPRPPTYYQLLGVSPGEQDPEVLEEAALRQAGHVRTYQTGPYAQQCVGLLNEIAQARATLLDPDRRREYDARLGRAAGEPAGGAPPCLREYREGETLEDLLARRGRLSPVEAADILRLAFLRLQELHERGRVAGDLGPARIVLVRPLVGPGGEGRGGLDVRLLERGEAGPGPPPPGAGEVPSDVRCLGGALYQALAGHPPGRDLRPLPELNPEVPEGLAVIVGWMIDPDPARRYQTAGRAASALEVFLLGAACPDAPSPEWAGAAPSVSFPPALLSAAPAG